MRQPSASAFWRGYSGAVGEGSDKAAKIEVGLFPGAAEITKDVVKDLAKPLYEDALKPAALQVGRTLETAGRAVNAALGPLRLAVYGWERLEEILEEGIAKRLVERDVHEVRSPPPYIAVPALEALRYTAGEDELREMFLNLLATSMDAAQPQDVHPSFVETIKQLSSDEGRIMALFDETDRIQVWAFTFRPRAADMYQNTREESFGPLSMVVVDAACTRPASFPTLVDNLQRLRLLAVTKSESFTVLDANRLRDVLRDPTRYGEDIDALLCLSPRLQDLVCTMVFGDTIAVSYTSLALTDYGRGFYRSCVAHR